MALTDLSGKLFQKNLLELAKNIEWKNEYAARVAQKECESLDPDNAIYTDRYASAARKLLEYYSVSELKVITDYPKDKFDTFINTAPAYLTRYLDIFYNYEEPNSYYRMLYGKPPLNCEPKYWVLPKVNNQWGLPPNEPVHDVSPNILRIIENDGGLDKYKKLIEIDKTFEYVNHMTDKKIYPFVSRLAGKFDLLYVPETSISKLSIDFRETYDLCRDFMIQRYYSEAYRGKYEHYEGLIGMAILFQTIQQMHVKYLDADITRDFYDIDSIKLIYEAYSVPFFEEIPVSYHQKIVKAMNRLLMYKGDNQVFVDLCSLFDYNSLEIYKYYLVREQRVDSDGNLIFSYKNDGTPNYDEMYDIFFSQGTIDGDPYIDICDSNNRLDYNAITSADPYWVNDAQLIQKVYESEYNFTETKYIGLQMVFSITQFMMESCYFIHMIMDNRYPMSFITVSHGKLGTDIDLFTLVIYIHAIICKRYEYEGNIPDNVEHIGRILGFNFKDDINIIIGDIMTNPYMMSDDSSIIVDILQHMQITDSSSCKKIYENIKKLYTLVDDRLLRCKDPNVYFAYKNLYRILLTTEYMTETFRKSGGKQATSFMDLLEDLNMSLALRIQEMTNSELMQELNYSLIALQKVADDLKYITSYGGSNGEVIAEYLYKLIRVFKSAKVDLVDFKSIYVVDGRSTNMLKLMIRLKRLGISYALPNDKFDLVDNIAYLQKLSIKISDDASMVDHLYTQLLAYIVDEKISIFDKLRIAEYIYLSECAGEDDFTLIDNINEKTVTGNINSRSALTDKLIRIQ